MTMKIDSISLQRRRLMIAGAALTVVPAAGFATARSARAAAAAPATARHATALVVSGRLLAADGQPLAGASVLAWQLCGKSGGCSVISDADGRFVFSTAAPQHGPDGIEPMRVCVTRPAGAPHYADLHFGHGRDTRNSVIARTLPDHGTLRASFELTLS